METKAIRSNKKGRGLLIIFLIIIVLLVGAVTGFTYLGKNAAGDLLTHSLLEPLDGAITAKVTIDPGDGNLAVDGLTSNEQALVSGTLQYFENIGAPASSVSISDGQATLMLKAKGGYSSPNLPWADCNGGTEWQIHLNPSVAFDITALTGGGNVILDLTGLTVTRLVAETGGGNMEVILPDNAVNLDVTAKTGAGKVTIEIGNGIKGSSTINASSGAGEVAVLVPSSVAASIKVTQGTVITDSRFKKIDDATYQTADYQSATDKVEIIVGSGAGKVAINTK